MNAPPKVYRPAAAVIPFRADGAVLVGRRTPAARSYIGYLAFPGGGRDEPDAHLPLVTDTQWERAERACAMRELGEETGRWLVVDSDLRTPTGAICEHLLQGLREQRSLGALLGELNLRLDDRKLISLGRWHTTDGRPRQFAVRQFLLPLDETTAVTCAPQDELDDIRWRQAGDIQSAWRQGRELLLPPIRHVVTSLAERGTADLSALTAALIRVPAADDPFVRDIVAGVGIQPFRTPTLPPATHTNTVLLGSGDFLIVDPATPFDDERERFDDLMATLLAKGRRPVAIVLTHHHVDHASDAGRVSEQFDVPIWAHAITEELVDVPVSRRLEAGDVLACRGEPDQEWEVLFTPGHAPGHVCLLERSTGVLVAGDMVASTGSILIEPHDGHMGLYLESLAHLASRPVRSIVPSHGPLLAGGTQRLEEQIAHRRRRQVQVAEALARAPKGAEPIDLVPGIYGADIPETSFPLAALSVHAALQLLVEEGLASEQDGVFRPA